MRIPIVISCPTIPTTLDSRACVLAGIDVGEWFPVNVGLRQGCVISLWLFNVYVNGVVREVNARVLGRGLELLYVNGGSFEINQLSLLMTQHCWLIHRRGNNPLPNSLVNELGRVCES